jgi:2-polyprenyl-6-methoxyphenol hydroxylase-like FAD-dependent oxidoreductase
MSNAVKQVVIVGGGTAGWLAAGIIAAEHKSNSPQGLRVTLVESPDVKTIGVGEGTWPTLRQSLQKIGISETDFIRHCDASFKQGAKFARWATGEKDDYYYHPLILPQGYYDANLVPHWQQLGSEMPFADAVSCQGHLCEAGLAPKQITTPEFAAVANYAYHLDAGKFAQLLQKHCTENLGVVHVLDHVTAVIAAENGDIAAVKCKQHGPLAGDLFIDCTGMKSLLLGEHYGVSFLDKRDILFNDRALAVHAPYPEPDSPIASHTIATAHGAGWIWDIGLPTRRGVGCVYSSSHMSDEEAEQELRRYLKPSLTTEHAAGLTPRKITIRPGHREKFWHRNCVAVGMAAGFLEPLEASAIVLIELASGMLSEQLPASRDVMDIAAKRFNDRFLYRWDRIIEFLKLHYCISKRRDSDYWIENCNNETVPERLQDLLKLWRYQAPDRHDFPDFEEVFPAASYQYVLYGMGFETRIRETERRFDSLQVARRHFDENRKLTQRYLSALPTNRDLINKIRDHGLQKI